MSKQDNHYLKAELDGQLIHDEQVRQWFEYEAWDGLWYWDLENQETLWLSPQFKSLLGYHECEATDSMSWLKEQVFREDLPLLEAALQEYLVDPDYTYEQIVRYRHKDDSTLWLQCRGVIIRDDNNRATRMLGVHTDLTELKMAHQALEEKHRALEYSNQQLEKFAFVAAHDLKCPVKAIQRLITWIDEDDDELPPNTQAHFNKIKHRSNRLEVLLNDLLQYARIDQPAKGPETIQFDRFVTAIFELLNNAQNFDLQVDVASVYVEKTPFELIIRNLLSNVIKHHHKGEGKIKVTCEQQSSQYWIQVIDDGPGIPSQYQKRVFELFETLKTKQDAEGSGIGLAMVQKAVTALKGELKLASDGICGTTFTITLPVQKPQQ